MFIVPLTPPPIGMAVTIMRFTDTGPVYRRLEEAKRAVQVQRTHDKQSNQVRINVGTRNNAHLPPAAVTYYRFAAMDSRSP